MLNTVTRYSALLLLIFCTSFLHASDESILKTISVTEAQTLLTQQEANPDLVILDIRTANEFAQGHLAQAKQLDFYADSFEDELNTLDKDATYLIYCRSGGRSGKALKLMSKLGFKSVYNMEGGFSAWDKSKLPSVK